MAYVAFFFGGLLLGFYAAAVALHSPMDPDDRAAVNDMIYTEGYEAGYQAGQAQAARRR